MAAFISSRLRSPRGRLAIFLTTILRVAPVLVAGMLLFGPSHGVHAQDREGAGRQTTISRSDGEALFQEWIAGQRELLTQLDAFSIEADVDHRVATSSGERFATYGLLFGRPAEGQQARGTLRYFILDGDSLDVSERRRVDRIISSMMTDELGPLLNGLTMPARLLSRVRAIDEPVRMKRDGRNLIRYTFELEPPNRGQSPVQRPGVRPGGRPGFQGPGRRPPTGGIRSGNPQGPGGSGRPDGSRPRMNVFIDEASGELVMTRIRAILPGDRVLTAETTFQRVQGIDLPLARQVAGDFPMRRRLRTVTVELDHRTRFRVERLSFADR